MNERAYDASTADDLRLLQIDIDTMFVMSASGRIERENDPDRSTGPRVFFVGCPSGNLARVRHDVDDTVARRILEVAAEEPRWRDPDGKHGCGSGCLYRPRLPSLQPTEPFPRRAKIELPAIAFVFGLVLA